MIRFLYGKNTDAKSNAIINAILNDTETGKESILIVPDQMAVSAEKMTLDNLPRPHSSSSKCLAFHVFITEYAVNTADFVTPI